MSLHTERDEQCSLCHEFASGVACIRHHHILDLVDEKTNCPYYHLHRELNKRLCEESGDWWKTSLDWAKPADSPFYMLDIPAGLGYKEWCDVFTEVGEFDHS